MSRLFFVLFTFASGFLTLFTSCQNNVRSALWDGVATGKVSLVVNGDTTSAVIRMSASFVAPFALEGNEKYWAQAMANRPTEQCLVATMIDVDTGKSVSVLHAANEVATGKDEFLVVVIPADNTGPGFMKGEAIDASLEYVVQLAIVVPTTRKGHYLAKIGCPTTVPAEIHFHVNVDGRQPIVTFDNVPARTSIEAFTEITPARIGQLQTNRLITLNPVTENGEAALAGELVTTMNRIGMNAEVIAATTDPMMVVPKVDGSLGFSFPRGKKKVRGGRQPSTRRGASELMAEVDVNLVVPSDEAEVNYLTTLKDFLKTYGVDASRALIVYPLDFHGRSTYAATETVASALVFGTDKVLGGGGDGGGDRNRKVFKMLTENETALAVRAIGCVMCHSQINGNVTTDFGHGDPQFFGTVTAGNYGNSSYNGHIYGNHANNLADARIFHTNAQGVMERGTMFVPQAALPAPYPSSNAYSLKTYLDSVLPESGPGLSKPLVTEREVYIGAPTEAMLAAASGEYTAEWKYFPDNSGDELSGLEVVLAGTAPSATPTPTVGYNPDDEGGMGFRIGLIPPVAPAPIQTHVRNVAGQPLVCEGDLFVKETLLLNNLQLQTGNNGCRIHVVKSVFLYGQVVYLGDAVTRHLQITSVRSIIMGIGLNQLYERFMSHWTRPAFIDRRPGDTQSKLTQMYQEAVGLPIVDASLRPEGRAFLQQRLILNAPQVHSRNQGEFNGIIIAEVALMSLGAFQFKSPDFVKAGPIPFFPRLDAERLVKLGEAPTSPLPVPTPNPYADPYAYSGGAD